MADEDNDLASRVAANLGAVRSAVADTAAGAGRDPSDVTLVAVSKKQPDVRIEAALAAGQRVFGENYVQEAQARWGPRRADYTDLQLHLVGPLQTNKAVDAVELFDVIETLDRDKLAGAIAKAQAKVGRRVPCLIQVNTGEEPQKAGIAPTDVAAFLARAREVHGLDVRGLMAIPPVDEPVAPHFALLAQLGRDLDLHELSMGMSDDYPVAIRLGATSVRVGTAIFGPRPQANT